MLYKSSLFFICIFITTILHAQIITTIAGTGTQGYNGDSITAVSAELYHPNALVMDTSGNLYIAEGGNNRVRMLSPSGIITTVAGTGTAGFNGDYIAATSAQLFDPTGLALDDTGNLYICDWGNNRIRKLSKATGIITTIAGTGIAGYNGDNINATTARLNQPFGIATDIFNAVYIAEAANNRIRKVSTSGIITTVAGTGTVGYNGDNTQALSAQLSQPFGVIVNKGGLIYIADVGNDRVRMVDVTGLLQQ